MKNIFAKFLNKLVDNPIEAHTGTAPVSQLYVDLHSHLIPGIDDGAKTMNESIAFIWWLKELGFTKIITTPHVMAHRYNNSSETILQGLEALRKELVLRDIDIAVEASVRRMRNGP